VVLHEAQGHVCFFTFKVKKNSVCRMLLKSNT
jgi:hypothetical protein